MAVKKKQPATVYIKNFYGQHKLLSIVASIIFQLLAVFIFGVGMIILGFSTIYDPAFWIILAVMFIINLSVNLILMSILLEPISALTRALSHIAGEASDYPPPNPNSQRYEKNGIKNMIELIYSFGVDEPIDEKTPNAKEATGRLIDNALAHSASSIVILNSQGEIAYSSTKAPVRLSNKDKNVLDLVFFSGDQSLEEWIKECEKSSITAEKIWTRIHTDPDSSSEKRIFDIAASYSRNSDAEVTLLFFDRTSKYSPDEKDLDFIAFAAHELRGPITVIRGYLDILEDELHGKLDDDQKTLLQRLQVSAGRLSTYITNILNVSRYDRKHYRIDLQKEHIHKIYNSIADDMEMRATAQHRMLSVDIPRNLPAVAADTSSICEVFSNLIDNAIKYSNEGGMIKVEAHTSGGFVEVNVIDHGIGMPDSVVKNLFHKFYRSHRSRESVAGSGIGLYMSKAIIESHGGSISVRSSENKGSTFTFSMPIYDTVADKLKAGAKKGHNNGPVISKKEDRFISNHNMFRG